MFLGLLRLSSAAGEGEMTESEYARKLDELDRLLNDPDVPMEPAKVWSLLAEIAQHDASIRNAERNQAGGSGPFRGDQELAVAFRSGDWAFGNAQDAPTR